VAVKQPSVIAREALKRLAERKLPPTPVNYQACYYEITGSAPSGVFPVEPLRKIALALTARTPKQKGMLDQLDAAIGRHSWQSIEDALSAYVDLCADKTPHPSATDVSRVTEQYLELLPRIADLIESGLPALGSDDEQVIIKGEALVLVLRDPEQDIDRVVEAMAGFNAVLAYAAETQVEIRSVLLKLLHLILENVSVLSINDSWLKGQIDALLYAVSPPLDLRRLDNVERRIREVLEKQAVAKVRSLEAQEEMRRMLSAFIERLVHMGQSSANFRDRISESARRIEQVESVEDLAPLLKEVIQATRDMEAEAAREHDQLEILQSKAKATEAELAKLHQELLSASVLARHDPLTDALNRKGLDEALLREISNMQRLGTPLSIGLLDIDNFKKLNDRLGHESGDAALVHLVNVLRNCLRPPDCLARYGGEEFVILMPDTTLDGGIQAMIRFQRELTRHFFLAGGERILITFSAGVAQFGVDESGSDAIKRADQAMYLAKRAGKNRVMGT